MPLLHALTICLARPCLCHSSTLDTLAMHRHVMAHVSAGLQWGAWTDVGMAVRGAAKRQRRRQAGEGERKIFKCYAIVPLCCVPRPSPLLAPPALMQAAGRHTGRGQGRRRWPLRAGARWRQRGQRTAGSDGPAGEVALEISPPAGEAGAGETGSEAAAVAFATRVMSSVPCARGGRRVLCVCVTVCDCVSVCVRVWLERGRVAN